MDTSLRVVLYLLIVAEGLHETQSRSMCCPSRYRYLTQPPTALNCNPLGVDIRLLCDGEGDPGIVIWYWTQNVSEAGVRGTAIFPGDTSDNFSVLHLVNRKSKEIVFTVSESTLGYYWCEISNAANVSLRPSTITPVCLPMNNAQQNQCDATHILNFLHHGTSECAEKNSPMLFSRPPLPTNCASSPSQFVSNGVSHAATVSSPPPMIQMMQLPTTTSNQRLHTAFSSEVLSNTFASSSTQLLPSQLISSVASSTNTPVPTTDHISIIFPLVALLALTTIILLASISLNIALCRKVKRHTEIHIKGTQPPAAPISKTAPLYHLQECHFDPANDETLHVAPNLAYMAYLRGISSMSDDADYETVLP